MTSSALLHPAQLARLLAERISRHYHVRVSVRLNAAMPQNSRLIIHFTPPLTLSLSHLYQSYREHPADLDALLQLEVQMLDDNHPVSDTDRIMPYLKSAGWLQDVQHQLHGQQHSAELKQLLISKPWFADLFVCYVYKNHTGIRYLTPQDSQRLGFADTSALHQKALDNLRRHKKQVKCYELEGGTYSLILDGIYDASLLLIISEILSEHWLKQALIAVPAHNELLLTRNQNPESITELSALVREVREKTAHPVSDNLYIYTREQLRLFHIISDKSHDSSPLYPYPPAARQ